GLSCIQDRLCLNRLVEQAPHVKRQMNRAVRIGAMQLRPNGNLGANSSIFLRHPAKYEGVRGERGKGARHHRTGAGGLAKLLNQCFFVGHCFFGAPPGKTASALPWTTFSYASSESPSPRQSSTRLSSVSVGQSQPNMI